MGEYNLRMQYTCVPCEYSESSQEVKKFHPAYNKRCHHYLPRILRVCDFFELGVYLRNFLSLDSDLDDKLAALAKVELCLANVVSWVNIV